LFKALRFSMLGLVRSGALLTLALLAAAPAAAEVTVSPVVLDLQTTGRRVVANVNVRNTGAATLPVEIKIQPLRATANGLEPFGEDTGDLLIVPPMAAVPAGQTQSFRVQWVGDPDLAQSRHFFVTVAQLPVKLPEGQSAVQIVYNFQVLVSVAASTAKSALTVRSASIGEQDGKPAPVIEVANNGAAHGYLSQASVQIVQADASGKELFSKTMSGAEFQQLAGYGLVASGQTRRMTLPLALPSKTGTITAQILEERSQ
jgi:P pilus assembly chaperone PapD